MLVSLSVDNFRSFNNEETFSLVASARLKNIHPSHLLPIPNSNESVLRTAIIYGANGAGKSNLFKALEFISAIALHSDKQKNQRMRGENFAFFANTQKPSSFDLQFIANNKLYRFGFECDDEKITEEWLIEVNGDQENIIYERTTNDNKDVEIKSTRLADMNDKTRAVCILGGPQNQSFLATINAMLGESDFGEEVLGIINWFETTLDMIAPDKNYGSLEYDLTNSTEFSKFAGDFLRLASTGVDELISSKTEITSDELKKIIPADALNQILPRLSKIKDGQGVKINLPDGENIYIEDNHYYKTSIRTSRNISGEKKHSLKLKDESDGTRRLLNLMPALHKLHTGNKVYFVDEIDRSLHPILVRQLIEYFLSTCVKQTGQLIMTTHESTLLDLNLVRKDEIWFAEKDQEHQTRLYSLSDFEIKDSSKIRENYFIGRYGAIPFLGGIAKLIKSEANQE